MPSYDTVEGIEQYLTSVEGLNRLVKERGEAGYVRKERLNQFLILGHWHMDTCGNVGKATCEIIVKKDGKYLPSQSLPPSIPKVIRTEDLYRVYGENLRISTSMTQNGIPQANVLCPDCGKGWTIDNVHKTFESSRDTVVPMDEFVGQTLDQVREHYRTTKTDGFYLLPGAESVRNDRLIDMTVDPKFPNLVNNRTGWMLGPVPKGYTFQKGDEARIVIFTYQHTSCHDFRNALKTRQFFQDIVDKAGFKEVMLNEVPNEYCPCEVCGPWFKIRALEGSIKIGWRKRVINIDLSEYPIKDCEKLFPKENVTKWEDGIHAWGGEKAVEYLSQIRAAL